MKWNIVFIIEIAALFNSATGLEEEEEKRDGVVVVVILEGS